MTVKGTVKEITQPQKINETQSKRIIIVEFFEDKERKYAKSLAITFFGDKASQLDGIEVGSSVEVGYSTEAKKYNNLWYNNVNGWKINKL